MGSAPLASAAGRAAQLAPRSAGGAGSIWMSGRGDDLKVVLGGPRQLRRLHRGGSLAPRLDHLHEHVDGQLPSALCWKADLQRAARLQAHARREVLRGRVAGGQVKERVDQAVACGVDTHRVGRAVARRVPATTAPQQATNPRHGHAIRHSK